MSETAQGSGMWCAFTPQMAYEVWRDSERDEAEGETRWHMLAAEINIRLQNMNPPAAASPEPGGTEREKLAHRDQHIAAFERAIRGALDGQHADTFANTLDPDSFALVERIATLATPPRAASPEPGAVPLIERSREWWAERAEREGNAVVSAGAPDSSASTTPRRIQLNRFTAAERAIYDAVQVVEAAGADVRLTDAVVLLQAARDSVADFVDGIDSRRYVAVAPRADATACAKCAEKDASAAFWSERYDALHRAFSRNGLTCDGAVVDQLVAKLRDKPHANATASGVTEVLIAALRDIATNYDHDEQTREHTPGYGGACRVCTAEAALRAAQPDGGAK